MNYLFLGFEVAGFALALVCLFYIQIARPMRKDYQRFYFILLIICLLFAMAFDLAVNILRGLMGDEALVAEEVLTCFFLFADGLLADLLARYSYEVTGAYYRGHRKFFRGLYYCLGPLGALLTCINFYTQFLYSFPEDMRFTYRSEWLVLPFAIFYFLSIAITLILDHKRTPKKAVIAISATIGLFLFGLIFQWIFPSVNIELFCGSLGVLLMMCLIEADAERFDSVTQLLSPYAFDYKMKALFHFKKSFRVLALRFINLSYALTLMSVDDATALRRQIADKICESIYTYGITLYLLKEDEIIFVIERKKDENTKRITESLASMMKEPFLIRSIPVHLESVLVTLNVPADASSQEELMAELDFAQDALPRGNLTVMEEKEVADLKEKYRLHTILKEKIANDEIEVYYQPIWSAETNKIVAAEALLRLKDDKGNYLRPDKLVALAEKDGSIGALDQAVLRKVAHFYKEKQPSKYGLSYIEVNLSLYEMLSSQLIPNYQKILREYDVPTSAINLEFLETANNDFPVFDKARKALLEAGFRLSLDDFGTEYSNMERLFTGDFVTVKVDKSLLWSADKSETARNLLASTLEMLRKMGFNALQEGVETKEQLDFVLQHGCNLVQGYYFSKALPEEEFIDYIKNFNHVKED